MEEVWKCAGGTTLRWVSDEDGLRCYFSEPDRGGLTRLECYRRLLAPSSPGSVGIASAVSRARLAATKLVINVRFAGRQGLVRG